MKRIRLSKRFRPFNQTLLALAILIICSAALNAQTAPEPNPPAPASPEAVISVEALQTRIARARALIAAHRLEIAASELESIRTATRDNSIRNVTSIMLMSVYLEEGNYARAESLLEENFQARAAQKDESLGTYFALAGQAVNGARTHLARYRSFGVRPTDANLPAEAATDLNRLRSLLERMIAQAQAISDERKAYDSLSLLEDVLGIRLSLARDIEDQTKWSLEYAKAREVLASSQTQIASLGGVPPLRPASAAANKITSPSPYSKKKVSETPLDIKAPDKTGNAAASEQQPAKEPVSAPSNTAPASTSDETKTQSSEAQPAEAAADDAGSLNAFATRKVVPRYPPLAKQSGAAGLVRVHVIVEGGKVITVSRSEGPMLLRKAAEEAARQWSFQLVSIEGRPTRLSGYIDFNFTL